MLNLNFFYYPSGQEEDFFMDEDGETIPILKSDSYTTNGISEFGVDHFSTLAAVILRLRLFCGFNIIAG